MYNDVHSYHDLLKIKGLTVVREEEFARLAASGR